MHAEIITIGDELLIGQIVNTNSSWIAKQLNVAGFHVNRITAVSDNKREIHNILHEASKRSKIVLITGGLGPTSDDITKPALCEYFDSRLVFNHQVFEFIEKFVVGRNAQMNELNKKQAEVLADCDVIFNNIGTAPGMWIEKDDVIYVSMPGVPYEMEAMMTEDILPRLRNKFVAPYIYHFTILTQGIAESRLAELIQPWEKQLNSDIKLAYLPSPGIVKLRLSCIGNSENEVKELINNETEKLKRIISEYIFGYNNDTLEGIIGQILVSNGFTLSTAESCTGGKIAHIITTVPGCSAYYKGGIVAYSNDLKINLLQVNEGLLLKNGAVSKEVVESMAQNACRIFMSDFSVSTSGIAGPTGGSPSKPLGTTWIAVASRTGVHSEKFNFGDNRERNIIRATITALNMLRKSIIATK